MTPKQLAQVEEDYAGFISTGWRVVMVEQGLTTSSEDRAKLGCGICGDPLDPSTTYKRITFIGAPSLGLTHVQAIVCRNGVACRRRVKQRAEALHQLAA